MRLLVLGSLSPIGQLRRDFLGQSDASPAFKGSRSESDAETTSHMLLFTLLVGRKDFNTINIS